MTKQPTSDYQKVDRRFDEKFYKFYNGKNYQGYVKISEATKALFHSELDRVREETKIEIIEHLGMFLRSCANDNLTCEQAIKELHEIEKPNPLTTPTSNKE